MRVCAKRRPAFTFYFTLLTFYYLNSAGAEYKSTILTATRTETTIPKVFQCFLYFLSNIISVGGVYLINILVYYTRNDSISRA